MIHYDARAPINDFVLLNEDGVVLWFPVRIEFEASQPSLTLKMIDRAHSGDFQVAKHGSVWKDDVDVIGDDALVVRL